MKSRLLLLALLGGCVEGVEPATLEPALLEARRAEQSEAGGGAAPPADGGPGADVPTPPPLECGGAAGHVADTTCLDCLESACCAPAAACFGEPGCVALLRCAARCGDDAACTEGCTAQTADDALAGALHLRGCWARACPAACPTAEAPTNLVGALGRITGAVAVDCTTGDQCANLACADCNDDLGDACETSLRTATDCGACGRDCGGTACHPAGACEPEVLATGYAAGVALGEAGLAWLGRSNSTVANGEVQWLPARSAEPVLVARGFESAPHGDVVLGSGEVFFSGQRALFRAPLQPAAEPPGGLLSVLGGRLLGTAGGRLHALEQRADQTALWRWPLPAADAADLLCTPARTSIGAVDPDTGTLYLADSEGLVSLPANSAFGPNCPVTHGTLVAGGQVTAVAAAGGQVAWLDIDGTTQRVWLSEAPGAAPRELGRAVIGDTGEAAILVLDGEVLFVDAAPLPGDPPRHLLLAVAPDGTRRPLAVAGRTVNTIRADATHIYWSDTYEGLRRVPR